MNGWEQNAVAAARQGQPGAYASLVERYATPIRHSVQRIVGDDDGARDVTQQAFVSAYEHLADYDPRHRFFSWVYRIALNEALNVNRRDRHRLPLGGLDPPAPGPSPEEALLSREQAEGIHSALGTLPLKYRILVALRYFLDFSYAEIAGILDLPATTVKSRLYTARRLMRSEWERRERQEEPGVGI